MLNIKTDIKQDIQNDIDNYADDFSNNIFQEYQYFPRGTIEWNEFLDMALTAVADEITNLRKWDWGKMEEES